MHTNSYYDVCNKLLFSSVNKQFHGISKEEILDDLESFDNFNQFFFRKLKPGSRPIAYPDDPVSVVHSRVIVFYISIHYLFG